MAFPRKLIAGAVAAGAAATAAARLLRLSVPELPDPVPGSPDRYRWRHADIFLTRRGEGPAAALFHDLYTGASGAEMERLGDHLEAEFTLHTVDLPGFGRSSRPRMRYGPDLYIDAIVELVRHHIDAPTLLIGSGLAAAYAAEAAVRLGDAASGVVLLAPPEPVGHQVVDAAVLRPLTYQFLRSPFGEVYHHVHAVAPWRRHALQRDLAIEPLDLDARADALERYARQPDGSWPLWSLWVGDLDWDARPPLARLGAPALALWGAEARRDPAAPAAYATVRPDLAQEIVAGTGRWPHVDAPEQAAAAIRTWWAAEGPGDERLEIAT